MFLVLFSQSVFNPPESTHRTTHQFHTGIGHIEFFVA
jgi:hypothetical protein